MGKVLSFPVARGLDETALLLDLVARMDEATTSLAQAYRQTRPGPARTALEALAPQWRDCRSLAGRALAMRREINGGHAA